MVGVGRAGLEFQALVPDVRLIVLGVDKKRPDAGNVCGLSGPEQGIFEECLSLCPALNLTTARRPNQRQRRVNVDFPVWMIASLDKEAARIGITRQSLINLWLAERLEQATHKTS